MRVQDHAGPRPHSLRSWANPGGPMPPSTGARAHGQMILKTASGEQETERLTCSFVEPLTEANRRPSPTSSDFRSCSRCPADGFTGSLLAQQRPAFTCGDVAPRMVGQWLNHSSTTAPRRRPVTTGCHRTDRTGSRICRSLACAASGPPSAYGSPQSISPDRPGRSAPLRANTSTQSRAVA